METSLPYPILGAVRLPGYPVGVMETSLPYPTLGAAIPPGYPTKSVDSFFDRI